MKYDTRIGLKGSEQDAINDAGKLSWFATKLKEFYEDTQPKIENKVSDAEHQALDDVVKCILTSLQSNRHQISNEILLYDKISLIYQLGRFIFSFKKFIIIS